MQITNKKMQTEKLVLMALLTALVAVLSYFGGFIKVGGLASVSLTLVPVVLGSALLGPAAGAWLGGVSGVVFFFTADGAYWLSNFGIAGTVITVMVKGIAAGLCAGLAYKMLQRINRYVAVLVSAIVCPVVNTAIFSLGCFIFFFDDVQAQALLKGQSVFIFFILFYIGWNFVFELLANILLSPAILRVIHIKKK